MTEQLQLRRGTATQVAAFTGAIGEVVVDTTDNRLVVNDGASAGGWPAARLNDNAVAFTGGAMNGVAIGQSAPAAAAVTALGVNEPTPSAGIVNVSGSYQVAGAQISSLNLSNGQTGTGELVLQNSPVLAGVVSGPDGGSWGAGGINGSAIGATTPAAASVTAPAKGDASARAITSAWFGQNLPGGLVNKFRNGTMDAAQRGTSGAVTAATAYSLDGWQITAAGASVSWAQEWNANIAGSSLRLSCLTGITTATLQQRIESTVAADLLTSAKASQTITVQWTIYNNSGAAITPKIATGYASARDNFSTVTADLAATNLQTIANGAMGVVAYTFTPSSANLANGYQVQLQFGAALNAGSGYIDVGQADIRLTPGLATGLNASPPPPELRPVFAELPLNQRYYQAGIQVVLAAQAPNTTSIAQTIVIPAMRATPTLASAAVSNSGNIAATNTLTALSASSIEVGASSTGAAAAFVMNQTLTASAEL